MEKVKGIPDIATIKGWPAIDNLTLVNTNGVLYAVTRERKYLGNGKQKETKTYYGRVVDGVYYSMEEFRLKFKRGGILRSVPAPELAPTLPTKTDTPKAAQTDVAEKKEVQCNSAATVPEEEKLAGAVPLLYAILKDIHIVQDLEELYGKFYASFICAFAIYIVLHSSNVARRMPAFLERYATPLPFALSDEDISAVLKTLGTMVDCREKFFAARTLRCPDYVISFDSTDFPCGSESVELARVGIGKNGVVRKQLKLSVLFGHNSYLPIRYRLFQGNVNDQSNFKDLIIRLEDSVPASKKLLRVMVDRGYFSAANIKIASQSGHHFLFAAMKNSTWEKELIAQSLPLLENWTNTLTGYESIRAVTIKSSRRIAGSQVDFWYHVYLDTKEHADQSAKFIRKLRRFQKEYASGASTAADNARWLKFFEAKNSPAQKNLVVDEASVKKVLDGLGIFANLTTWECSALEAYETYRGRDFIEKGFRIDKSGIESLVARSHSVEAVEGRMLVGMVAMALACQVQHRMRKQPDQKKSSGRSRKQKSLDSIYNGAEGLYDLFQGNKVIRRPNGEWRFSEVTAEQRAVAKWLGCEGCYDEVPDFLAPNYESIFRQSITKAHPLKK